MFFGASLLVAKLDLPLKLNSPLSKGFSISSLFKKHESKGNFVYGFLPYWNIKELDNIQYENLTDIAYFGVYINPDGTIKKYDNEGNTEQGYNNWRNSKELADGIAKGKKAGTRFSLTLISHSDDTTEAFLNCRSCWETLELVATKEMAYHKIRDIHLNFEYSTYTDEQLTDKFTAFTEHFSNYLKSHDKEALLVVSAFADSNNKQRLTDIKAISEYVDGIFIMGYDFRTAGSEYAGPTAPLDGIGTVSTYDIRTTIKDYVANAPASKIILGVPYYGYNWPVTNNTPYSKKIASNVLGAADIGAKAQTYQDIMAIIEEYNIKPQWDEVAKVPYFTYYSVESGTYRQIYYEDKRSLTEKFSYARDMGLGGIGIWALGYDGKYLDLWNLLKTHR